MSAEAWFINVISGKAGVLNTAVRGLLSIAEPAFAAIVRRRNRAFDQGRRSVVTLERPVLCVGNLTTGGTGKTPAVAWLVKQLLQAGRHPGIITRGYRGGDEPAMLARQLGVPIEANPIRAEAGRSLLAAHPEVDVLVMDDGFQHRQLHRDADLLLIDATRPFGFDHLLPRGLLREPITAAARATAVLITRSDRVPAAQVQAIRARLGAVASLPIFLSRHAIVGFTNPAGQLQQTMQSPVLAFCGLGNPAAWFDQLRSMGLNVIDTQSFADHHPFTTADLAALHDRANIAGAVLLTTEKDRVRLPESAAVWTTVLELVVDDPAGLLAALRRGTE